MELISLLVTWDPLSSSLHIKCILIWREHYFVLPQPSILYNVMSTSTTVQLSVCCYKTYFFQASEPLHFLTMTGRDWSVSVDQWTFPTYLVRQKHQKRGFDQINLFPEGWGWGLHTLKLPIAHHHTIICKLCSYVWSATPQLFTGQRPPNSILYFNPPDLGKWDNWHVVNLLRKSV